MRDALPRDRGPIGSAISLVASSLGLDLSEEAAARLEAYVRLVLEWGARTDLVSSPTVETVLGTHIRDSLAVLAAFRFGSEESIDMGSGAGFPGIPIAIASPETRVVLGEARAKRAAFLRFCVAELDIGNAEVYRGRLEDYPRKGCFAYAFSRGTGPVRDVWELARPLLASGGRLVMWKGGSATRSGFAEALGVSVDAVELREVVTPAIDGGAAGRFPERAVKLVSVVRA